MGSRFIFTLQMNMENLLKVNKLFGHLLILSILFAGCSDTMDQNSAIRLSFVDHFVATELVADPNGDIYCIGFESVQDSVFIRTYDSRRNLQRSIDFSEIVRGTFRGRFLQLPDGNWVAANSRGNFDTSGIDLMLLDRNFNIVKQKEIYSNNTGGRWSNTVNDLMLSRSGDILMAWDTTDYTDPDESRSGLIISKFTTDFDELWSFKGKGIGEDTAKWAPGFCRLIEMEDGDICYALDLGIYYSDHFLIGRLSESGTLKFQQLYEPYSVFSYVMGVGKAGNDLIVQTIANFEYLFLYSRFSGETGDLTERKQLHFLNTTTGFWNNTASGIPKLISSRSGHFAYSKDRRSIYFQKIDEELNLSEAFDLVMPPFDSVIGCKHVTRENGNIVVSVSYLYMGEIHFALFELNGDGSLH